MTTILHNWRASAVNTNSIQTMLLITTTRLLQLQTRYLCDFKLIPDNVAALLELTHLSRFVNLFANYMRDAHAGPFATRNARACVLKTKMTCRDTIIV